MPETLPVAGRGRQGRDPGAIDCGHARLRGDRGASRRADRSGPAPARPHSPGLPPRSPDLLRLGRQRHHRRGHPLLPEGGARPHARGGGRDRVLGGAAVEHEDGRRRRLGRIPDLREPAPRVPGAGRACRARGLHRAGDHGGRQADVPGRLRAHRGGLHDPGRGRGRAVRGGRARRRRDGADPDAGADRSPQRRHQRRVPERRARRRPGPAPGLRARGAPARHGARGIALHSPGRAGRRHAGGGRGGPAGRRPRSADPRRGPGLRRVRRRGRGVRPPLWTGGRPGGVRGADRCAAPADRALAGGRRVRVRDLPVSRGPRRGAGLQLLGHRRARSSISDSWACSPRSARS